MTCEDHIRGVLGRDDWVLRAGWPALEDTGGMHVIVYDPDTDTWGRSYVTTGSGASDWTLGYYSAAAAADDVEEIVRLGESR